MSAQDARAAMSSILRGEASTAQIASFAVALRMKGETAEELRGLALAMRENGLRVEHGLENEPVLDTCGTGGDGLGTLNVSTIAALVVAGAGVRVAKHGNRSSRGHCGSADLMEALGARLATRPVEVTQALHEIGFAFLFAPAFHPAMKNAAPARQELQTRTAFNLLGPLTNPAGANVQVVGAPDVKTAELLAVTLASLGLPRGFVVHGDSGLDEVSTTGPTQVFSLMRGAIDHFTWQPADFGVASASIHELLAPSIEANKEIALAVLRGERGAARDIILVNAAAGLLAAGAAGAPREACAMAAASIDTGRANVVLDRYIEFTQRRAIALESGQ